MDWLIASHFSHVSASPPGWLRQAATVHEMRSVNGGWHGVAGWGYWFRGFSEAGAGLRADDGADSLPVARSPLAAADLRLAELRPVSEIPGAAGLPALLAGEARRSPVLGHGGAFQADQAGGAARRRRRVPPALTSELQGGLGVTRHLLARERWVTLR